MARPTRAFLPGYPMHFVVRGNDRQDIFRSEGDRLFFMAALDRAARRYELAIHAYVLMSNHVHLLGTPRHPESAARTFQSAGVRYVKYFNEVHQRTGTLWEGRYHASLVQTDAYLFACMRYIEMNPVRAGLCRSPMDHPWSSHRFHARGRPDTLLTPHAAYLDLSSEPRRRQAAYLEMFARREVEAAIVEFRRAIQGGWAVGDESFVRWAARTVGRRTAKAEAGRPKIGVRDVLGSEIV